MFKKLVVGALAAGIALTGGVASASACENTGTQQYPSGLYYKYEYSDYDIFANSYTEYGITWYFKGSQWKSACGKYEAYYEGRR
jgi:hypothetical protein